MDWAKQVPARDVSEKLLEYTGNAMLTRNFDLFQRCFYLPHYISTTDSELVIEDTETLRSMFDRVAEDYRRKRVTDLVRICEVAAYKTPTRIEATHTTHMMSGNDRIAEPYPGFSVLDLVDGRWLISSSQYAVDRTITVGRALAAHGAPRIKKQQQDQEP